MTNFINDDPIKGITYMNYFNATSNGLLDTGIGTASTNIKDLCLERWGASSAVMDTSNLYLIPNSEHESKSNRVASSSNYRLILSYLSWFGQHSFNNFNVNKNRLNSSTVGQIIVDSTPYGGRTLEGVANTFQYAVVTNNCLIITGFGSSGLNFNTAERFFSFGGWLSDSVFSDSRRLAIVTNYNDSFRAFRPGMPELSTAQSILTSGVAQYTITCASDTGNGTIPGADLWATDLWLRDNTNGYAIGRIPHVLLAKGSGFTLGNLYYNPTVIDGVTDQKIWLCCANYGTDKLLMRVWTEGIV